MSFLADVCRRWESAADPARAAGVRVVHPRLGVVLGAGGGMLGQLLLPFRLGLGGRLGTGGQWTSWISLDDAVAVLRFLLREEIEGPVATVAPEPVTNRRLTAVLAAAVHRPALLPVPAFALRLLPGRMGEELLLASVRVRPGVLAERGFSWALPTLEATLERALGSESRGDSDDRR